MFQAQSRRIQQEFDSIVFYPFDFDVYLLCMASDAGFPFTIAIS